MHKRIPRFGHSNNFSSLASSDDSVVEDYKAGVSSRERCGVTVRQLSLILTPTIFCFILKIFTFCVLLVFVPIIWMVILVVLNFYHGHGGDFAAATLMVDTRGKQIQNVCLLGCIGIILLSALMLQLGLIPFESSMSDLRQISDMVENRINSGLIATTSLGETYDNLKDIANSATLNGGLDIDEICPDLTESKSVGNTPDLFIDVEEDILSGINQIRSIPLDYIAATANNTLARLRKAVISVDNGFENVIQFAWKIKIFVAMLDAFSLFLILNVLFARCDIDVRPFQRLTTFVVLPSFCCFLLATLIGTGVLGMLALANAGKIMRPYLVSSDQSILKF
jgi:hypothetical protein